MIAQAGESTGDRKPLSFDPKNRDHWRELAKPVRLFTYGGGEPWGMWFVQCAQPWHLSIQPALREGLNA